MPVYFEFEVSLCRIKPRIWRRFLISSACSFYNLHEAIQCAAGWGNAHLFEFRTGSRGNSIAGLPDDDFGKAAPDANRVGLNAYFGKGKASECLYEYDFGDSWEHDVKLLQTVEMPDSFNLRLLDGQRAFPPEDCGGVGGYQRCIKVLKGARDPDNLREWLEDWQPEAFDLEAVKKRFDC